MIKQIRILTRLQLCNLFRINELKYTKDRKEKGRILGMGLTYIILIITLMTYILLPSYALCKIGLGNLIPSVLTMTVFFIVLFFTLFKAESIIYGRKYFDLQISLPVSKTDIVISRFLTIYSTNLMFVYCVMIPGIAVYGFMEKPSITVYIYGIIGTFFMPLLPITAATILGAFITAISARVKHKSIVSAILTMAFALTLVVGNMRITSVPETEVLDMLSNIAGLMEQQIAKIYPPAVWLSKAMTQNNIMELLKYIGISIIVFMAVVFILQKYYLTVQTLLNATYTNGKYMVRELNMDSLKKSLWKKEIKRYFASSIYVTNTMIGYILMAVTPFVILFMGEDKMNQLIGVPEVVKKVLPVLIGMMPLMMPTTASSISMEGKQWWIAQTLPIPMKEIINSKINLNLTIVAPFYVIAEVVSLIALKPTGIYVFWLILVPALSILFSALVGITINLKFPVFSWENEVQVVKQSLSTFLMILIGFICTSVPIASLIIFDTSMINTIYFIIFACLVIMIVILKCLLDRKWSNLIRSHFL